MAGFYLEIILRKQQALIWLSGCLTMLNISYLPHFFHLQLFLLNFLNSKNNNRTTNWTHLERSEFNSIKDYSSKPGCNINSVNNIFAFEFIVIDFTFPISRFITRNNGKKIIPLVHIIEYIIKFPYPSTCCCWLFYFPQKGWLRHF